MFPLTHPAATLRAVDEPSAATDAYRPLTIGAIERETASITSYWLARPDGLSLPEPTAGQYLPIAVAIPGIGVARRTYTISGYEEGRYRLTIRRENRLDHPPGLVSNHVHENWVENHSVHASAPRGTFVLDTGSRRPILMLAGGIGITPLLAMLRDLATRAPERRVDLVISVRDSADFPFRKEIDALGRRMARLRVRAQYSRRSETVPHGEPAECTGRIDEPLLGSLISTLDTDVYLCGPAPFMTTMNSALTTLGVHESQIRFECFGPATLERRQSSTVAPATINSDVTFVRSGISSTFDPRAFNLLEFAEDVGVDLPFGCRSGTCGTCATRKLRGEVRYVTEPTAALDADQILPCCSVPVGEVHLDA